MKENNNLEIINNLKKEITDIKVYTRKKYEGYKRKELEFCYLTKGSLLEKEFKENDSRRNNLFWYTAGEKEIDELAKKDPMEIFEFLAPKHLERDRGYGEKPKQFKTPCHLCNQKSLTTVVWSKEEYLERFFCRLCMTAFDWIDIKDDPIELQIEMKGYYLALAKREVAKDLKKQAEISKELEKIQQRTNKRKQFIEKTKSEIATWTKNK